jgi:hypothetical protein
MTLLEHLTLVYFEEIGFFHWNYTRHCSEEEMRKAMNSAKGTISDNLIMNGVYVKLFDGSSAGE